MDAPVVSDPPWTVCLEQMNLALKVRYGLQPDSPELIQRYLLCRPGFDQAAVRDRQAHLIHLYELLL
ncbi:MAG: hypothetical protein AAGI11_21920 [Pseudomonadota bacterium]